MSSSSHQWFVQTDFGALLGPMPADVLAEMARTCALLSKDQVREGADGEWRSANELPGLFEKVTPPQQKNAAAKPVAEELDFEVDAPLAAPATAVDPLPMVASIAVVKRSSSTPTLFPPNRAETATTVPISTPQPPPPPSRSTAWESPVLATVRRFPTSRRFSPKPSRWKWTLVTWSIVVAVSVVLVAAWWIWPRQRPDIYARYIAIYKELQQRRDDAQGQAGWNEFVARANSELDESVSWLEPRAKPGDREKSLLLYAGRDLQEMLEHSRDSQPPHQKRLDVFFEQLQQMYEPKK